MSTTKALPVLCILFLFLTSSPILPCTEAARTLEKIKADGIIYPGHPFRGGSPYAGLPYTRPSCRNIYHCETPENPPEAPPPPENPPEAPPPPEAKP